MSFLSLVYYALQVHLLLVTIWGWERLSRLVFLPRGCSIVTEKKEDDRDNGYEYAQIE